MKRMFTLLLGASALLLVSCNDYGKKLEFGKAEVYYKGDSLTEADARKVGDYLLAQQILDSTKGNTVQLTREKGQDGYQLRIVRNDSSFNANKNLYYLTMWRLQDGLTNEVFGGKKTRVILANERLKDIETVADMKVESLAGQIRVYSDPTAFNQGEARQIVAFLQEMNAGANGQKLEVVLQKANDRPVVHFFVNREGYLQNQQAIVESFKSIKYAMSKTVFGGKDIELVLNTLDFNELTRVPDADMATRAAVDQMMQQGAAGNGTTDPGAQMTPGATGDDSDTDTSGIEE